MRLRVWIILINIAALELAASSPPEETLIAERDRPERRDDEKETLFDENIKRLRREAKEYYRDQCCQSVEGNGDSVDFSGYYNGPPAAQYNYYYTPQ